MPICDEELTRDHKERIIDGGPPRKYWSRLREFIRSNINDKDFMSGWLALYESLGVSGIYGFLKSILHVRLAFFLLGSTLRAAVRLPRDAENVSSERFPFLSWIDTITFSQSELPRALGCYKKKSGARRIRKRIECRRIHCSKQERLVR